MSVYMLSHYEKVLKIYVTSGLRLIKIGNLKNVKAKIVSSH